MREEASLTPLWGARGAGLPGVGCSPCGGRRPYAAGGKATPAAANSVYPSEGSSRTDLPAARGPLLSSLATCLRTGRCAPPGPRKGNTPPQEAPRLSLCFTPTFTAPESVRNFKYRIVGRALWFVNESASLSNCSVLSEEVACVSLQCTSGYFILKIRTPSGAGNVGVKQSERRSPHASRAPQRSKRSRRAFPPPSPSPSPRRLLVPERAPEISQVVEQVHAVAQQVVDVLED